MNDEKIDGSDAPVGAVKKEWGKLPDDHFGYANDEERIAKRGLEDWELVEDIPKGQKRIPRWFYAVIAVVLLVAFTLTLPFWGDRPENPRPWFTWGHFYAVIYFIIGAFFINFMVNQFAPAEEDEEVDPSRRKEP